MNEVRRNGISDAGWLGDSAFLGGLDVNRVNDAVDLAGFRIIQRAAAVAGVGGGVELDDVEWIAQGAVKKFRYAKIAQVDTTHDIALLRLEGEPLPTVQLGDSDTLVEGQALAMTGYPIGMALQQMVTHRGMVSSIGPIVLPALRGQQLDVKMVRRLREPFNIIQLDATAYPGNSGSPLYDPQTGKVLGIIDAVFVKATKESALTAPSGITYAIPANFIRELLNQNKLTQP